jgi:hypothetical protein
MLTVYTVAIGETDAVQAPEWVDPTVRYLCFSDRPCPAPYQWIEVPTAADGTPESRRYKVLADHPALDLTDLTLYHDASYRLTGDLCWVRDGFSRGADLVAMRHPSRTRIEDEAARIARYGYVTIAEGQRLVAEYRTAGYDDEVITSAGLFARRQSSAMWRFNRIWWAEVQRWRFRDQASLGYAAWRAQLSTEHLPGTIRDNPYAVWREPVGVLA